MPKIRMKLELGIQQKNPKGASNLADIEDRILEALLDHFNNLNNINKSNWVATSIKITHLENKKCGIFWKKLR